MRAWLGAIALLVLGGCASPGSRAADADAAEAGLVVLDVTIGENGEVLKTEIVTEEPAGYGFGQIAMENAESWEFKDSEPGTYRIKARFELDDPPSKADAP